MKLLSVNVSQPKRVPSGGSKGGRDSVPYGKKTVETGIFKEPVTGRVALRTLNLDGDGQADLQGHGGMFKAAYVYSIDYYEYWRRELDRDDFAYGQFGENFTVEGMTDDQVYVGDVFEIGTAQVEVTQPRVPCFKLAMKMGIEGFERTFLESLRVGFYLRVLREGEVGAGDVFRRVRTDPEQMTVEALHRLGYFDTKNHDEIRRALRIPALSTGWRVWLEKRLTRSRKTSSNWRTLRVERKVPESDTITSFYLAADDGRCLASFLPGQFLTLRLDVPGQPAAVTRTYSLSDGGSPPRSLQGDSPQGDSPQGDSPSCGHYRLSIRREDAPVDPPDLPAGLVSSYFHDRVEPGMKLEAADPRGKFVLDTESRAGVVLVSAGVGVTPLLSMLHAVAESGSQRPVFFVHGARCGREHAFGAEARRLAADRDHIDVHISYSRPKPEDVLGRDYDSEGRVDVALLESLLPGNLTGSDDDFYLCGPSAFMQSLFEGLRALGVPESRIHYEHFGPATVLRSGDAELSAAADCCSDVEVRFARSGVTAAWNPSLESLLELAEANGLNPPFSCRSGICHTCVCGIEAGEVEYVEEPVDPPEEGSVLLCCCKPVSDVTLDV